MYYTKRSDVAAVKTKIMKQEEKNIAAVQQNGYAVQYIENPSEAVQLAAVQQNGHAVQYIENPSEAVQLAAVQQNGHAVKYIKTSTIVKRLLEVGIEGAEIVNFFILLENKDYSMVGIL